MALFEKTFRISSETRVLDVGGSPEIWRYARVRPSLTLMNLPSALVANTGELTQVAGDGRMLPFRDGAFDIVFSNSVIEHVGTRQDQQSFASEVARVGRHYWIQTPNRRFPIELHLMMPLVHRLPKPLARAIVKRFTVWQLLEKPTEPQRAFYINHFLNELNLLDAGTLQSLFPAARILTERTLGLAKSLIAVRT
ncbi:MAG: class I SAM-dependent methyltransferase [Acidobacteriaceae bacterium]|nr:class I SAM-dependent methyltransferase [Acidobacteriaceae bacterium]